MGDRKRYGVLGIATLILVVSSQSCGGSQEYVDSPDARQAELGHELSLESDLPIARTPASQTVLSSSIRENDTVLYVAGAVGDRSSWVERVGREFESRNPGFEVRLFDPNSDQALQEMARGTLDLLLTSKALSYAQKRQGLRQERLGLKTWVPIVNPKNPLFDLTRKQLREILEGRTHHWSALGKHFVDVQKYILDPEDSGQREAWQSLWPEAGLEPKGATKENWLEIVARVASDPGGVALVPLDAAQAPGIKVLSIEGKRANYQTIVEGRYPLSYPVYITYSVECCTEAQRLKDSLKRHEAKGPQWARPGR